MQVYNYKFIILHKLIGFLFIIDFVLNHALLFFKLYCIYSRYHNVY